MCEEFCKPRACKMWRAATLLDKMADQQQDRALRDECRQLAEMVRDVGEDIFPNAMPPIRQGKLKNEPSVRHVHAHARKSPRGGKEVA